MVLNSDPWLLGGVVVSLAVLAALLGYFGGLLGSWPVVRGSLRAILQLAAVSALITFVLRFVSLTVLFLIAMATVATVTSAARTKTGRRGAWVALAIVGGSAPLIVGLLAVGLLPLKGIAMIPVGGILIGGAMTATTLSARRGLDELTDRRGEYEAALSLGFTESVAARAVIRRPAAEALVPVLDQTRTVGVVTLPGAFVGMLLGGASPWQAGALQLVVLIGLLVVESVAIVVVVELISFGKVRRDPLRDREG